MSLKIKFTNTGKAALVNPDNIGTAAVDITEIRLGSANYDPTGSETDLQTTIKSLNTFGGVTVADDVIHVTIRDDSSDTYTIGEIGLYSGTGVLMGIISSAATAVITQKGPNDILLVSADAAVTEVDVTNLTFGPTDFIYPPATPTTQGVIEVADAGEVQAGTPNKAVDAYELQQELSRRITSSLSDQSTTKMAAAKAVYDLNQAISQINSLLLSDTATLDTLQEIVDFIQLNRSDLDALGIASIAGLQSALDGKSPLSHGHPWGDISGKPSTYNPVAHSHSISEVTGLQSILDGIADLSNSTLIWSGSSASLSINLGSGLYVVSASGFCGVLQVIRGDVYGGGEGLFTSLINESSNWMKRVEFSAYSNLLEGKSFNKSTNAASTFSLHKVFKVG